MDNSKPYLDQENLDDIIVYSHSLEVWNPEYSVAGKEAVRERVLRLKCYFLAIGSARVWFRWIKRRSGLFWTGKCRRRREQAAVVKPDARSNFIFFTTRQLRRSRKLPQPRRGLYYRKPKNLSLFTNFLKGESDRTASRRTSRRHQFGARGQAELAAEEIR